MTNYAFCKYLPANQYTLQNLINCEIYFNTVNHFDDPMDDFFHIATGGITESLDQTKHLLIKHKIEERLEKRHISTPNGIINQGNINTPGKIYLLLEELLKQQVGVFSASRLSLCTACSYIQNINPVMFSTYASNQQGIVIEFEELEPKPEGQEKPSWHKVNYISTWKHFYCNVELGRLCFQNEPSNENDPWQLSQGFFDKITDKFPLLYKFKDWTFQNEYRLFDQPGPKKLKELNLKIKRIYLGPRIEASFESAITKIFDGNKAVKIVKLKLPTAHGDKRIFISKEINPVKTARIPNKKIANK